MKVNQALQIKIWVLGLALALIAATFLAVSVNSFEYGLITIGLLFVVVILGLLTNVWGGLVASGVAVFAIFLLNQYLGVTIRERALVNIASELIAFLAVGPLAGGLSVALGSAQTQINHWLSVAEEQTTHDPLLGALKPHWAKVRLNEELLRASATSRPLALVMLRFEQQDGLAPAELRAERVALLQGLIRVARAATRPPVVVAHGGGDLALLILPEHTAAQAQDFASAFQLRLQDEMYFPAGKTTSDKSLGKRMGTAGALRCAVLTPNAAESADALFDRAKSALDGQ